MDWHNVEDDAAVEIQRQGEVCLDGTVQFALASDQRAVTLCGIFGAGAVALLAAAATLLAAAPNDRVWSLIAAALVSAVSLLFASLFCAAAARPADFYVAGYEPRLLVTGASDRAKMIREAVEDVQRRIDANRKALSKSGRLTVYGLRTAAASVFLGTLTFVIALSAAGRLW